VEDLKVYIVIINWNGWKDTIECLESVFRNDYSNYQVVVCDNGSLDGSMEHITAWAAGGLDVYLPKNDQLRDLSFPPVSKPIRYVQYDRKEAESGGKPWADDIRLILIQTSANLGFAGGNNVGFRYALARDDFAYIWLLNNDTVIRPDALIKLVMKIKEKPKIGMCGSTLLYYHDPELIQAAGGGHYNKWLGTTRHLAAFKSSDETVDDKDILSGCPMSQGHL